MSTTNRYASMRHSGVRKIRTIRWLCIGVFCVMVWPLSAQETTQGDASVGSRTFSWQPIFRSLSAEFSYGFNVPQAPSEMLRLRALASSSWQMSLYYHRPFVDDLLGLYVGLSIGQQWMRWRNEAFYLAHIADSTQFASVESYGIAPEELKRNVFSTLQVGLPIWLEIRPMKKRKRGFSVGVGGYVQYVIQMRTKLLFDRDNFREKNTLQHVYALSRWQYGLSAKLSFHVLFVSYRHALHSYFLKDKVDNAFKVHSIAIGLQSFY